MGKIKKALLAVARSRPMGGVLRLTFAHACNLVPLRRRAQSETAVVFDHPVPMVPGHLLIVPKRGIPGLDAMRASDGPWLDGFVALAFRLLECGDADRVVLVNGGSWQDVRQLHGHLLPATAIGLSSLSDDLIRAAARSPVGEVLAHPEPARQGHWLIPLAEPGDASSGLRLGQAAVRSLVSGRGYALVLDPRSPCVQLIAGGARSAGGSNTC